MFSFPEWMVGIIGTLISALVGWLVGRRKENADLEMSEIDRLKKIIETWDQQFTRLKQEKEAQDAKITHLEEVIDKLQGELRTLKDENSVLRRQQNSNVS